MTNIYFVRHCKVEYTEDDYTRPLSEQGKVDVHTVTQLFGNIEIDVIISSPYIRAIETINGVAKQKGLPIEYYDDLRERKLSNKYIDDYQGFVSKQWKDFSYKLDDGEALVEVQSRGNKVITKILNRHKGKNVIIGTHGTFLALQLNYYDSKYSYDFWKSIKMPDVFKFEFDGNELIKITNLKI